MFGSGPEQQAAREKIGTNRSSPDFGDFSPPGRLGSIASRRRSGHSRRARFCSRRVGGTFAMPWCLLIRRSRHVSSASCKSRGWSRNELQLREESQFPLERKRKEADYVVDNSGDEQVALSQLEAVLFARCQSQSFLKHQSCPFSPLCLVFDSCLSADGRRSSAIVCPCNPTQPRPGFCRNPRSLELLKVFRHEQAPQSPARLKSNRPPNSVIRWKSTPRRLPRPELKPAGMAVADAGRTGRRRAPL